MKKIYSILKEPIEHRLSLFLFLLFFSSVVDFYEYTVIESLSKACFIFLHHFAIVYGMMLILCLIRNKIANLFFRFFLIVLLIINFIIDLTCAYVFNCSFGVDIAAIIVGTNISEIGEFIDTFFTNDILYLAIVSCIFLIFLYFSLHKLEDKIRKSKLLVRLLVVLLAVALGGLIVGPKSNWKNVSILKCLNILSYTKIPDLRDYQKQIPLKSTANADKIHNIVLILGESFSRSHSSLYGYTKQTNPILTKLYKDSLLLKYDNVKSAGTHTISALKGIMSTFRNGESGREWFECPSLIGIINQIGYKTYWISNQSQKGAFDNVAAKYSELCDSVCFVGNRFSGMHKKDYDGLLLEPLKTIKKNGYNFFIVHMMGSHFKFEERYPSKYNVFTESEYDSIPVHQRKNMASYDNSVLYNDYVVANIINLFAKEESLIFYFSDHGLDLYETSDDYIGHARSNDKNSIDFGSKVPFFIYTSPLFKKRFPEKVHLMEKCQNKAFNTENYIYSVMDILDISFSNNEDVERYSLFK